MGAAPLGALLVWGGFEPFVDAVRTIDPGLLLAAAVLSVGSTTLVAWRWRVVAGGLGLAIGRAVAVAACYRSMFLNLTLPGGVLGDVHRGVDHGLGQRNVGRALRAVAWERVAGQGVQVLLTAVVLLMLPSPLRLLGVVLLGAVLAGVLVVAGAAVVRGAGSGPRGGGRLSRAVFTDLRRGVLGARAWPVVLLASVGAVVCHVVTFWLATAAVGVFLPATTMIPVAAVVLLVAAVPANVAGWGPREGAAAWTFAAVGLDPALGVTAAAVFGLLALATSLPGLLVLVAGVTSVRRNPRSGAAATAAVREAPAHG